jgi:hypothetical protein
MERPVAGVEETQHLPDPYPERRGHHQKPEETHRSPPDAARPTPPRVQQGRHEHHRCENRQRDGQLLRVVDELSQHGEVRERPTARSPQVLLGKVASGGE